MKTRNLLLAIPFMFTACNAPQASLTERVEQQFSLLLQDAEENNANPRTFATFYTDENGVVSKKRPAVVTAFENYKLSETGDTIRETHFINARSFDWTEGFFPGSCWYMYELTGDKKYEAAAEKFQAIIRPHTSSSSHDLGFAFNCSFGNGVRLTDSADKKEAFRAVMLEAANTLADRFNPTTGTILSWDADRGWQALRGWQYPVIIDNMMNLELLFEVTNFTGDNRYREVAIAHANTTLANHFRPDGSCYHVVDYSTTDGSVRHKHTAQGLDHESSWARGQSWAIYGYTMCYRYTQDPAYLAQAEKIASFIMNSPNMPADQVPLFDFDAEKYLKGHAVESMVDITNGIPRDASAAALNASAMYELAGYVKDGAKYIAYADRVMESLSSPAYLAEVGANNHFLLMHSVGSIPHLNEKDVPLNYADYYYIEALLRKAALEK